MKITAFLSIATLALAADARKRFDKRIQPVVSGGPVPAGSAAVPVSASGSVAPVIAAFCLPFIDAGTATSSNGTQLTLGGVGCSSTVMGSLAGANSMTSALITSPSDGSTVDSTQTMTISLDVYF